LRPTPTLWAILVLVLAGCGSTSEPRRSEELYLDFNELAADHPLSSVHNEGPDKVDVSLHTAPKATPAAVSAPGLGKGEAVRFPAYTASEKPAASVLVVVPTSKGALDPQDHDFSFGASFKLDALSEGTDVDNGNNLLQRGVFEGPAQFKLQVDGGRPSCRVLGDAGEVTVQAPSRVAPDHWYTVTCRRTSEGLTLQLRAEDGGPSAGEWEKAGSTGKLSYQGAPLTVGGKVDNTGTPLSSADQFNGVVDNVFFERS
jgi:hypothetical protein